MNSRKRRGPKPRPDPDGKQVMHSCNNPPCCNPEHLSAGTHRDNMKHMVASDRQARKYTDARVLEIYSLKGTMNGPAASRKLGIPRHTVHGIWSGRRWSRLTGVQESNDE